MQSVTCMYIRLVDTLHSPRGALFWQHYIWQWLQAPHGSSYHHIRSYLEFRSYCLESKVGLDRKVSHDPLMASILFTPGPSRPQRPCLVCPLAHVPPSSIADAQGLSTGGQNTESRWFSGFPERTTCQTYSIYPFLFFFPPANPSKCLRAKTLVCGLSVFPGHLRDCWWTLWVLSPKLAGSRDGGKRMVEGWLQSVAW